jgi:hypothetical protein
MIISLFSRPILDKYIKGLTFSSKNNPQENPEIPSSEGWRKNQFCAAANLDTNISNQEMSRFGKIENGLGRKDKAIRKLGILKKSLFFICGIEKEIEEESVHQQPSLEYDKFDPFWPKVCDFSAISIISITGFILAFLNKFN